MLRKIRIALAALFFAAITLLLLDFTGVLHTYLGWMAKVQLLPAVLAINVGVVVALLALTLLVGRVYCSVICPMGVMQDIFSWMGGKAKKNRFHYTKGHTVLRIAALVVFVLLMVFGLNGVAILVAPYSAYGRIATNLFQPVYMWLNNLCAFFAQRADSYLFYPVDVWVKSGVVLAVAAITFVVIGVLSFRWGRLWCNTICPVGTVLGFFAKFSWLKPHINDSKCIGCGKCAKQCKSQCINPETHQIDYSRCVACMDCLENCSVKAITLGSKCGKSSKVEGEAVNTDRRKFMVTTAAVGAAMAVKAQETKVDGGLAVLEGKQLPERQVPVKPFGSQGLKHFSNHCTACQLCVAECPEKVLRPSSKLSTMMQPEMVFDKGFCRPDCTRCSEVCPAGAIKKIDAAQKSAISVGHAVTVSHNCLLSQGVSCTSCSRHCPAGAITIVEDASTGHNVVAVNEQQCIGCGACEHFCPVRPFSAIYVEGREVHLSV
ncbi:MAG: 4Fe-4S binding protein [Bacteroidales bacterium]|nr:4Fe-4S binding protein [Bacteroidales bacterium]